MSKAAAKPISFNPIPAITALTIALGLEFLEAFNCNNKPIKENTNNKIFATINTSCFMPHAGICLSPTTTSALMIKKNKTSGRIFFPIIISLMYLMYR